MASYSFSWQVMSHPTVLNLTSDTHFEEVRLTEKVNGAAKPLLRETLSSVTIDNFKLKKVSAIGSALKSVASVCMALVISLTVAPCGVLVNGARALKALVDWKWNKGGDECAKKVNEFFEAFRNDLRQFTLGALCVSMIVISSMVMPAVLTQPLFGAAAKIVLGGMLGASAVFGGSVICTILPILTPDRYCHNSLFLRNHLGLVNEHGGLLTPSEANQCDFTRKSGVITHKGPLLELLKGWYDEASKRQKELKLDTSNPVAYIDEQDKCEYIKKVIENGMNIPIKTPEPIAVDEDLSLTSRALLHRNVLKWIMPPLCEEQRLPAVTDPSKPLYSRMKDVQIAAKVKKLNGVVKAFHAVRRIVVLAAVSLSASFCGIFVNGALSAAASLKNTFTKNPTSESIEKARLYANAFIKDLHCFVVSTYSVVALPVGVLGLGVACLTPMLPTVFRVTLATLSLFNVWVGAKETIFNTKEVFATENFLDKAQAPGLLRQNLALYRQFGLTDEEGNLLKISRADYFDCESIDGKVGYDDPLLSKLLEIVRTMKFLVPDASSELLVNGLSEIIKDGTGKTVEELTV